MAEIKESPYEAGCYFVGSQQWKIPSKYKLIKVLGNGSFSFVCLAENKETNEKVAIKFIPDVTSSSEYVKRVLREVCILRRISHPGIISLKDAFIQPSSTGPKRCVGGRLVASSIDLYLVLEYVEGGDLFSLRGHLSEPVVQSVMLQLLLAVQYLHSINVWHRDLKSANVLISTSKGGSREIKICDFGSARSKGLALQSNQYVSPLPSSLAGGKRRRLTHLDSMAADDSDEGMRIEDLRVSGSAAGGGLQTPLTRTVATPCYRAPEVIMSRGSYSAAIDMWSIGCIFGELLQRVVPRGGSFTPSLQIMPLFAVTWDVPLTPEPGTRYKDNGPENSAIRRELNTLFDLVGTPAWACIESVQSAEWRQYLRRLPGRAPKLARRFRDVPEQALDLVARLLTFEPSRRASSEEAMSHEYLMDLLDPTDAAISRGGSGPRLPTAQPMDMPPGQCCEWDGNVGPRSAPGAIAGSLLQDSLMDMANAEEIDCEMNESPEQAIGDSAHESPKILNKLSSFSLDPGSSGILPEGGDHHQQTRQQRMASMSVDIPGEMKHWQEPDPAVALEILEMSIERCCMQGDEKQQCQALREILEAEVCKIQEHGVGNLPPIKHQPTHRIRQLPKSFSLSEIRENTLELDSSAPHRTLDSSQIGRERLSYCADTKTAGLEADKHLGAGRHGEWSGTTLPRWENESSGWGSSTLPPGMVAESPEAKAYLKAISEQQAR